MRLNLGLVIVAALAVGCGSNVVGDTTSGSGSTGTSGSTGGSGSTGESGPRPTYPASSGAVAKGAVFPNLTVTGYLAATSGMPIDQAAGSFAEFDMQKIRNLVDGNGQPYRYMLLDLSAGWCGPCNDEAESYGLNRDADSKAKIATWLSQGGLFVTVLVQDYSESSPSSPIQSDVDRWLGDHNVQSILAADSSGRLSSTISQSAFPANLIIDLDSMKIVDAWYANDTGKVSEFESLLQ